jgi:hypothetical protein
MDLEKSFESITLETIDNYIANQQEENSQLEFKEVSKPNLKSDDDKKNLAKVLSGFANSSGGIVVWGVIANKKDGVDCASARKEIQELPKFMSTINDFTGKAVQLLVNGVKHKPLYTDQNQKTGLAVTLVPESDSGPHMALFREDRYYKRSGDSFYKMEHFDIEDMFGRRKKPKLSLSYILGLVHEKNHGNSVGIDVLIRLTNEGRGSARAPFLQIVKPANSEWSEHGADGNNYFGLEPTHYGESYPTAIFSSDADKMIHPGVSLNITKLKLILPKEHIREHVQNYPLEYKLTAMDLALKKDQLIIKENDLYNCLKNNNIEM